MKETDASLPDFRGRIVIFYLANADPMHALTLESPVFENHGGRLFVVGQFAPIQNWSDGLQASIAWDQLQYYIVFNSISEYHERRRLAPPEKKRGLFGRG